MSANCDSVSRGSPQTALRFETNYYDLLFVRYSATEKKGNTACTAEERVQIDQYYSCLTVKADSHSARTHSPTTSMGHRPSS